MKPVPGAERLTRKQVTDLLATQPPVHEEYEARLARTDAPDRDGRIHSLPDGHILHVLAGDYPGDRLKGTGTLYPEDAFERRVRWHERGDLDRREQRGATNSVGDWRFFSTVKHALPEHVGRLHDELERAVGTTLDTSYASLDPISDHVSRIGLDAARRLYDALVAHVGEVLRARVQGEWAVDDRSRPYPFVLGQDRRVLMPINVVWTELLVYELRPVDFGWEARSEARQAARRPRFT